MTKKGERKANLRDEFNSFGRRKYGEKVFSGLDPLRRSRLLTEYYVAHILSVLEPALVPDDERDLQDCMVDGSNDVGVDFIYRRDNSVLIIQSKFHKVGSKGSDEESFSFFADVLGRLHPESGEKIPKNQPLYDALADIDWDNDQFDLRFVTLSNRNERVTQREADGLRSSESLPNLEDRGALSFLGEEELTEELRSSIDRLQGIRDEVTIAFLPDDSERHWIDYADNSGRRSFIGRVSAVTLHNLYRPNKAALFNQNIRNYVGETATNKGMKATAEKSPEDFFYFNNGLSAIATQIRVSRPGELSCRDFSIINGAQTVRSLDMAYGRNQGGSVKKVSVLIRITQVSFSPGKAEGAFLTGVTRFNNTQNAVKVSDFRSNDSVQTSLQRLFGRLSYKGRRYVYRNKRDKTVEPDSMSPIGMEAFAKTIFSFQIGPPDMWKGTSTLFDTGQDGGYAKIFGDGNTVWESVAEEDFERLAGTWFLCDFSAQALQAVKEDLVKDETLRMERGDLVNEPAVGQALERKWLVFYVIGFLMEARHRDVGVDRVRILRGLSKPGAILDVPKVRDGIMEYIRLACEVIVRAFRNARKSQGFKPRNWFRNQETLRDIRSEVSSRELKTLPILA